MTQVQRKAVSNIALLLLCLAFTVLQLACNSNQDDMASSGGDSPVVRLKEGQRKYIWDRKITVPVRVDPDRSWDTVYTLEPRIRISVDIESPEKSLVALEVSRTRWETSCYGYSKVPDIGEGFLATDILPAVTQALKWREEGWYDKKVDSDDWMFPWPARQVEGQQTWIGPFYDTVVNATIQYRWTRSRTDADTLFPQFRVNLESFDGVRYAMCVQGARFSKSILDSTDWLHLDDPQKMADEIRIFRESGDCQVIWLVRRLSWSDIQVIGSHSWNGTGRVPDWPAPSAFLVKNRSEVGRRPRKDIPEAVGIWHTCNSFEIRPIDLSAIDMGMGVFPYAPAVRIETQRRLLSLEERNAQLSKKRAELVNSNE